MYFLMTSHHIWYVGHYQRVNFLNNVKQNSLITVIYIVYKLMKPEKKNVRYFIYFQKVIFSQVKYKLVTVVSEMSVPHLEFSVLLLLRPWKLGIYSQKIVKNLTTGSKDIVQTRKCHRIFCFSTAVTLKIRSRSPKSNQFFVMSQLHVYIHAHLERSQVLVHKILCRQSVMPMPMPTGSAPKSISPSPKAGGHKNDVFTCEFVFIFLKLMCLKILFSLSTYSPKTKQHLISFS